MYDQAQSYPAATLGRLVEEGIFSEPEKSRIAAAIREIPRRGSEPTWREQFIEQEGYDAFESIFRKPGEESE